MTLKTGVMMLKIQLYITGINYILNYISIETISYCFLLFIIIIIIFLLDAALMSIKYFFQKH